jgi:uncharacterized protein YjbI with pentapeptide repeats
MRQLWSKLFSWTGFQGKALWDWMELLIVPLVIAGAAWGFSVLSTRSQQAIEDQRISAQQQLEEDRLQHALLQSYITEMTGLLLENGLPRSELNSPVRQIARSNTLIVIRQLDGDRKGLLVQFLSESNLIERKEYALGGPHPIISLLGADLSGANLPGADLQYSDLSNVDLKGARLDFANLFGADLRGSNLESANLEGADLRTADLSALEEEDSRKSDIQTLLRNAYLRNAVLKGTKLVGANLEGADLFKVDLENTVLNDANLRNAVLKNATNWTNVQLAQANSLAGAIMPDGTPMTAARWVSFQRDNRP